VKKTRQTKSWSFGSDTVRTETLGWRFDQFTDRLRLLCPGVVKREGRAVVEKRALVDDDVATVEIDEGVIRRLVCPRDVALSLSVLYEVAATTQIHPPVRQLSKARVLAPSPGQAPSGAFRTGCH